MKPNYTFFLENIKETNKEILSETKKYLDKLAKPPGSLGKLERIAEKLSAINNNDSLNIDKRCVIVLSADNGVVVEGVSSAPQDVTAKQTINMLNGVTGVAVLAKQFNTDLIVADVGINADIFHPHLFYRKIRKSTENILYKPAMTREEAEKAVLTGIELVEMAKKDGYKLIGVGEMGIGNTTTSSAILSVLLGLSEEEIADVVGKGGGLIETAHLHKIEVIKNAIALHKPLKDDPIDILCKVGGLDIAAMTGVFIGSAYYGLPVVIDGFISSVAALCAVRLNPLILDYMFASHHSYERGYTLAINELKLSPCLSLEMRLGEGSGCPIMFAVMDAALAVLNNMATFSEANINDEYLDSINELGDKAF